VLWADYFLRWNTEVLCVCVSVCVCGCVSVCVCMCWNMEPSWSPSYLTILMLIQTCDAHEQTRKHTHTHTHIHTHICHKHTHAHVTNEIFCAPTLQESSHQLLRKQAAITVWAASHRMEPRPPRSSLRRLCTTRRSHGCKSAASSRRSR
jgi:hypothetical protein